MNRAKILKQFNFDEKFEAAKIIDKLNLCIQSNKTIFMTQFYTPNIYKKINLNIPNIEISQDGIFENSERKLIIFYNKNDINTEKPYKILKITNKSKFKKLTHKDYLGTLMSLGIKREKFSDLLVKDNSCYFGVIKSSVKFIEENLTKISNSKIILDEITNISKLPQYNFEEIVINIGSYRLDIIVTAIISKSRSNAITLIENEKVKIDYRKENNKSKTLKLPVTLTIEKFGKYILEKEIGISKKGKFKILIKKYI